MQKLLVASLLLGASSVNAHDFSLSRPDSHAPLGVMGDHTHNKDEVMISYRYMYMEMDDNRIGTNTIEDTEVRSLAGFPVAPTRMSMEMHMFGAMYAPSDKLTLMAMFPLIKLSMDHLVIPNGVRFTTKSDGIGDIKLGGLYTIFQRGGHKVHLNGSISFPTGSIDQRGNTPAMSNAVLPYPMQLGSGTFDFMPGITYNGQSSFLSWGAQAIGTIRLGENNADYTLGDKFEGTAWVAHSWNNYISNSFRIAGQSWGNIDGADSRLNPKIIATANTNLRAGDRIDALIGMNFKLQGLRIAAEAGLPIYQDLDGPQLETDWTANIGLQYAF